MRVIGKHGARTEIEPDPVRAWHRGRSLDAMLRSALPPVERGVLRATAAELNRIDEARAVRIARRINGR